MKYLLLIFLVPHLLVKLTAELVFRFDAVIADEGHSGSWLLQSALHFCRIELGDNGWLLSYPPELRLRRPSWLWDHHQLESGVVFRCNIRVAGIRLLVLVIYCFIFFYL